MGEFSSLPGTLLTTTTTAMRLTLVALYCHYLTLGYFLITWQESPLFSCLAGKIASSSRYFS